VWSCTGESSVGLGWLEEARPSGGVPSGVCPAASYPDVLKTGACRSGVAGGVALLGSGSDLDCWRGVRDVRSLLALRSGGLGLAEAPLSWV
jgi:hypothetical protein